MALISISLAWVAGIFLGSKLSLSPLFMLWGLLPLVFLPFYRERRRLLIIASLSIMALVGGAVRFELSLSPVDDSRLEYYNGRQVEIKGVVAADPENTDKTLHLQFEVSAIKLDGAYTAISGRALVFMPRYSRYEYGDELSLRGTLQTPPRLGDFDYPDYLAHQGIHSTMLYPKAEVIGKGKGSAFLGGVYSLRSRLAASIARALPEPQAALAQGMVLGIRGNIPSSLKSDLSRTGTAHILAISGMNISIVAGMLVALGVWLFGRRRYLYVWLALATIWLYALLAGMEAPVVRAVIMASLFLLAEALGRQRSAVVALAFAAAIMIGVEPQVIWMASFQLSFLAMAGLVLLAPPLSNAGRRALASVIGEEGTAVSIAGAISDSLAVSLGAVIAVFPLIAYYFGVVALASPLATLLILPALPGIIVAGFLTGALGLIAPALAYLAGWLAWLFLSFMLLVVEVFAMLPGAIDVPPGSLFPVMIYYACLAAAALAIWRRRRLLPSPAIIKPERRRPLFTGWTRRAALALAILAALSWVAAATMPDRNLHVSFLDVGEGDAILVQTPAHQDILIDGGGSAQALLAGLGDKMPFWDHGIDLVVLTHPHADHLSGLLELTKRFDVGETLLPESDSTSSLYREWLSLLGEKGIRSRIARVGQEIRLGGGVVLAVLSAGGSSGSSSEGQTDSSGVVLRLALGEISFLFTGDIRQEAEGDLVRQRVELGSTVLKVAHHGSASATSPEFLALAAPRFAVISCGAGNSYGHPSRETLSRLESMLGADSVYRTDTRGTIEFITNGSDLWLRMGR